MTFDLIVIGSGPGGYKTAVTAAQLGAKVALVESALPGGTCLNQGCVPKEALLRLAHVIEDAKSLGGRGLRGEVSGDFPGALAHKDEVVKNIRGTLPVWLRQLGIRMFSGQARLADARNVTVIADDESVTTLSANRIVIANGAAPRQLAACPTDGERILDSRDFMFKLTDLPESILCVGGGAIGTELAYLLYQFGSRVSIVEQGPRLLHKPCIPERASATLERKFARLGIKVRTSCTVTQTRSDATGIDVTFADGSEERLEKVLVAVGRVPRSAGLGLEEAGITTDHDGFIKTNEYLETSAAGVYAVGDVKLGPMTANAAFHDAKIAATNAVLGNQLTYNYNRVPIVIDSALQIAAVGLTEDRAESAGFEPDVARANLAGSTKARVSHDSEGYIEVVHDEETGQLLGGCIVGSEAGEMVHLLTAACQSQRGLWFFTDMNYSHPSWNEELENAIGRHVSAFTRSGEEVFQPGIYAIKGR